MGLTMTWLGMLAAFAIGGVFQRAKDMVVDYATWFSELRDLLRTFDQRKQRVIDEWGEWQRREAARGRNIESQPPDEVTNKAARIENERSRALRGFYGDRAAAIDGDWRRRIESIRTKRRELAGEMDDLRMCQRDRARLAHTCGIDVPAIPESLITLENSLEWDVIVARVLNPPQMTARTEPTPLVLSE